MEDSRITIDSGSPTASTDPSTGGASPRQQTPIDRIADAAKKLLGAISGRKG